MIFLLRWLAVGLVLGGIHLNKLLAQRHPARYDTLVSLVQGQLHADVLDSLGLNGTGVRIAVLDAGFRHTDRHPALAALRRSGKIVDTWDFWEGNADVYEHSEHGTQVLSGLAGEYQGRKLGFAPEAEFLLYRTEHETQEVFAEEEYWMQALARADSMGAQILVSSVNFTYARYSLADLNGRRIPVSRAAAAAAQRGMLLVVAMGNEGDDPWRYMGAPADVPSVLSVGGSAPSMRMRLPFASVGPNALGVAKPEISAPAFVLGPSGRRKYTEIAGTSFAAPLIGGLAACLLQLHPDWEGPQLYDAICRLGHLFPYYDYELGFGVPDLRRLRQPPPVPRADSRFKVYFVGDTVFVAFDSATVADSAGHPFGRMLHYHLQSSDSTLSAAYAVPIEHGTRIYYFKRRRQSRGVLRIWFDGYLWEEFIEMLE